MSTGHALIGKKGKTSSFSYIVQPNGLFILLSNFIQFLNVCLVGPFGQLDKVKQMLDLVCHANYSVIIEQKRSHIGLPLCQTRVKNKQLEARDKSNGQGQTSTRAPCSERSLLFSASSF